MKHRWKMICGIFLVMSTIMGVRQPVQTAEAGNARLSLETVGETAPAAYERGKIENLTKEMGISRSVEYEVTDTIMASLENGVLTLNGTGQIPDYTQTSAPWADQEVSQVILGEGITSIGEAAFYQKSEITSLTIADSVEVIEPGAFADCSGLRKVVWGKGIRQIGEYAFQNAAFTTAELPAALTDLSTYAFYSCGSLEHIEIAEGNTVYQSLDGVVFTDDLDKLVLYPGNKPGDVYRIPSGVTVIGTNAFGRMRTAKKVEIPKSVVTIEDWAFYQSSLETAEIPDSVKNMGNGPFDECNSLKKAVIGSGILELPYRCFYQCSNLQEVILKKGMQDIAHQAFTYCSSLQRIEIPEGVKNLKGSAFYGCSALEQVALPSTIQQIWYQVFCYCESLKEINLPGGLTFLGPTSFYGCSSLTALNIPQSVTEIGKDAFGKCVNLNVTLPERMIRLEDGSYIVAGTLLLDGTKSYTKAFQVLEIVNQERKAQGLAALEMDASLLTAAMERSVETSLDFSHDRPNGQECFSITDKASGENIAAGSSTPEGVMNQWMNSPGHRGNILGQSYQSIGIGCFQQNGVWYWVQMFGTSQADSILAGRDETGTYPVTVKAGVYTLYCDPAVLTLKAGGTEKIKVYADNPGWSSVRAQIHPSGLTWTSSNPAAASVSAEGIITAKANGSAVISCSLKDLPETKAAVRLTVQGTAVTPGGNEGGKDPQIKPPADLSAGGNKNPGTMNDGKKPAVPVLKSVKAGKKKAVIKWKRVKNADGYQIYKSRKKASGYTKAGTAAKAQTVKFTAVKLKKGKVYYFKVRSYRKTGKQKIYSKFSKPRRVRVK